MKQRTDHVAEAIKTVDETLSYGGYGDDAGAIASMLAAQVHATLALVEQQRIANVIALTRPQPLRDGGTIQIWVYDPVTAELRPDIAEGLGL